MATGVEPGTPQAAAAAWVAAIMEAGDLGVAWPLTDATLRLVLAQDWVWNHRHDPAVGHGDWEVLARGLAGLPPDSPLWDRFAADLVSQWQRVWSGFNTSAWGVWDQPEVLDLDLEMVTFVETGGENMPLQPGHSTMARRFALRHTESGWLVAGINGEQLFEPGWPPTIRPQA